MASEDVETEILVRMPLKSVMRCISVSKRWAFIIRGKDFRKRYLAQSKKRPQVLFAFFRILSQNVMEVVFKSAFQEEEPFLPSRLQQIRINPPDYAFTRTIGGLVCFTSRTTITICNPGTGQLMTTPELNDEGKGEFFLGAYSGYDETNDVFKLLCLKTKRVDEYMCVTEYIVHTVGSDSWRGIQVCEHRHAPCTDGLCIRGVLYIGAMRCDDKPGFMVISFNVMSEVVTCIELGVVTPTITTGLVNYFGDVAVVEQLVDVSGRIRFRVRNGISGEWREEHIVIRRWRAAVGVMRYVFIGTVGTRELVFAQHVLYKGPHSVLYYNKDEQRLREFRIDRVFDDNCYVQTHLNHVDTPSFPI